MKTKIAAAALSLCLLLALSGCGSALLSISNQTSDSISQSHMLLTGNKNYRVSLSESDPPELRCHIVTNEGELALVVLDGDGTELYRGGKLQSSDFTIPLPGAGKYRINATAGSHSGSYRIDWGEAPPDEPKEG